MDPLFTASSAPALDVQLLMWLPAGAAPAVSPHLAAAGIAHEPFADGAGWRLTVPEHAVDATVSALCGCLTDQDATATKLLRLDERAAPALDDMARVTTLRQAHALGQSRWLRGMIEGDRLTSHFQPIVEAHDPTRVFAYEALLRGRDDAGRLVAPIALLRAAREAAMLDALERAAQRAALEGLVGHARDARLFINMNPASVGDGASTLARTCALIDRLGIPHERVVFEIVEMDAIADIPSFSAHMRALQADGFRFALDDMGSGYSGLNLVHQLRPDFIKLDMALVRGVHRDRYKAVITETLLELARRLAIRTIAEGVEEPGELEWLRAYGVDYVQGYLIARPASPPPTPSIEVRVPRRA